MCRVAHAWLRGMRPRNGISVSHGVCHETRGLIARDRFSRRPCIGEFRIMPLVVARSARCFFPAAQFHGFPTINSATIAISRESKEPIVSISSFRTALFIIRSLLARIRYLKLNDFISVQMIPVDYKKSRRYFISR